jgi:hypothetical protein
MEKFRKNIFVICTFPLLISLFSMLLLFVDYRTGFVHPAWIHEELSVTIGFVILFFSGTLGIILTLISIYKCLRSSTSLVLKIGLIVVSLANLFVSEIFLYAWFLLKAII